jgi:hypothetical protein
MEKMFCPECGEEIGVNYVHPTKSFLMTDEGKFERNDNNLSDDPYLEFYCTMTIPARTPQGISSGLAPLPMG